MTHLEASGEREASAAPLRTLIVDDEPLAIERMQVLCAEIEQLRPERDEQEIAQPQPDDRREHGRERHARGVRLDKFVVHRLAIARQGPISPAPMSDVVGAWSNGFSRNQALESRPSRAIFARHSAGASVWTLLPPLSTATVTGMSSTVNS